MFAYNGLSATSWNHAVSCLVREIMPKMALFRSVNYQFAQIGCFLVESPSLLIKSTLLNPTYSWFMGEAQGQRQLRFGDRVKNTHIFERGIMGRWFFQWKWAQNTVTTDVFCIWWLWNLGEPHIFASCFAMMLEKHWQAQKKTQHNFTKHWQAPKITKNTDFQSMEVQNPE